MRDQDVAKYSMIYDIVPQNNNIWLKISETETLSPTSRIPSITPKGLSCRWPIMDMGEEETGVSAVIIDQATGATSSWQKQLLVKCHCLRRAQRAACGSVIWRQVVNLPMSSLALGGNSITQEELSPAVLPPNHQPGKQLSRTRQTAWLWPS